MTCKICNAPVQPFARAQMLHKYDVQYFQCTECRFVQTEEPYWLEEAYNTPIARSDYGLMARNITLAKLAGRVIVNLFNPEGEFLDFGAGYGVFTRLMRDLGLRFYAYDRYCPNLFSLEYQVTDENLGRYELLTAFEVLEHFVDPISEIERLLKLSDNLLFSTELLPKSNPKPQEWWYYAPHEGQHIGLFSEEALFKVAERFGLNLYTDGQFIHLLTRTEFPANLPELIEFERYIPKRIFPELREMLLMPELNVSALPKPNRGVQSPLLKERRGPVIAIDAIFFQYYQTGIARLWQSLLEVWAKQEMAAHLLVLDRDGTAPQIPGLWYVKLPRHSYENVEADREMLQQVCDREGVDVFISTYYTTPLTTPSVFMAYDMIPEVMETKLDEPMWQSKHHAIRHASGYTAISHNTAKDLVKFFPEIPLESIQVAHCGVSDTFIPADFDEIQKFRQKYGIQKPYFLLSGVKSFYKNARLFFQAFALLDTRQGFEILCTGSNLALEDEFRPYVQGVTVHSLRLSDAELRLAYAGAVALVYPSQYEGFGLPVLEAIACACPVITCANASIPEVAGDAAIYVPTNNVLAMADALAEVQKPSRRHNLISQGLVQVEKFSWGKMADRVAQTLFNVTLAHLNLQAKNLLFCPDWSKSEEELAEDLATTLQILAQQPDRYQTTLLVYAPGEQAELADLALSAITMNLMMAGDADLSEGPAIALLSDLIPQQWQVLRPYLSGHLSTPMSRQLPDELPDATHLHLVDLTQLTR